ncbi:hypothetical protein Ssi03_32770 [Sphaerisporangium siamense]|uniref:Uncharacterized protein n=1 Tax=Sphaerisporangium siamense TaxID=795645 RepID=A0A7W7D1L9_9ACTN|nr:hypothetical protein [Sphaerisporangium siamense]MBB4698654.1 hypothetical protein [Sphaerisporangium siamense]GII85287.1 hypothetical protein Ssi03_32770 [Sphaerisporangium siamense]
MKYVRVRISRGGNEMDPRPYLEALPQLAASLPPGAREFATDPEHYDFYSRRCVKDLALERVTFKEDDDFMELGFRHNCWKHEEDLTIRYQGVVRYESTLSTGMTAWSAVVLDEILPHPDGCRHELALISGSIAVTCEDLFVTWTEADCPDKAGPGLQPS